MATTILNEAQPLPDHWKSLGASTEIQPLPLWACRVYGCGLPKNGKTHFAASFPNALHIDFGNEGYGVANRRAHRVYCAAMEDSLITPAQRALGGVSLASIVERLEKEAKNPTFRTVIFDPIDTLQELIKSQMEATYGKDFDSIKGGTGAWGELNETLLSYPRRVANMGLGWVVLGHQSLKTVKIGADEITYVRPATTPGSYSGLFRDADYIIGFSTSEKWNPATKKKVTVYKVVVKNTENQRPDCAQGCRIPFEGEFEVPLGGGYDALLKVHSEGIETLRRRQAGA